MGSRLLATLIREDSGSEGVRYQHPGRVGTRVITDPMRSASFEQTTMPFGNVDSATSSDHPFSDYMRSAATGLDYAVNRWYDKSQGRFTTTDPISTGATSLRNPQSLNLYAYVGNDALNARDPSGLSPIELPPFPPDPGSGDVIEPEPPGDPGGGTPPASPPSSPVPPVPDRQTPRPPMQCGRSPRTGAAGLTFDASWDGQSDEQEMLDRAYNILSNFGPVNDWFQRNWDRDIFATPHRVEFQERSRFWGENANSTTNSHNGTMTFYASAFGNLNDLTASLMHELNNVAARYLAFYYDTPFLGGRGPKGSYTAETVAHQAYEAQCTATSP